MQGKEYNKAAKCYFLSFGVFLKEMRCRIELENLQTFQNYTNINGEEIHEGLINALNYFPKDIENVRDLNGYKVGGIHPNLTIVVGILV